MSVAWKTTRLKDVADIRVSNVDKKSFASELPVHLCNYMDVYANDYVIAGMPFMTATATQLEIAKFGLRRGDVMITKDSETPDDIGIPSVLVDEVDSLVCGYHLALIRPKADEVCSVYLAKQLAAAPGARYFGLNASGSTRFGIPVGAIENFELPLPELREQSKIAEVLSTVDRAIAQTEALIAKQQRIKTGLMQDLLTRGIDEHGQLRSEATHAFKDSPLGRIPVEWQSATVGSELVGIDAGKSPDCPDRPAGAGEWGVLKVSAVQPDGFLPDENKVIVNPALINPAYEIRDGDLLISRSNTFQLVGIVSLVVSPPKNLMLCDKTLRLRFSSSRTNTEFMFWVLQQPQIRRQIELNATGTSGSMKNISQLAIRSLKVMLPNFEEQQRIVDRVRRIQAEVVLCSQHAKKLRHLKTALMQDLLTGKVRVTPLLQPAEAASA